ncbi:hypothetical protein JCM19240_518 [Vibrio maritimus]|uniref:Uncharacterized protein n=1 Tax=Vibrio maritimus TaxID=990268 RepID=A0A090T6V5_9VIBR|nr:hypothetical protein JCM19240_518 [Vibrio maritimus]
MPKAATFDSFNLTGFNMVDDLLGKLRGIEFLVVIMVPPRR